MTNQCLICFNGVRKPWAQPLNCPCRPSIHQACWEEWAAVAGPQCVICRSVVAPVEEPDPEPELEVEAVHWIGPWPGQWHQQEQQQEQAIDPTFSRGVFACIIFVIYTVRILIFINAYRNGVDGFGAFDGFDEDNEL
jgi:hypothetical protein